jgi:long-chain acyl-CoA synthetase
VPVDSPFLPDWLVAHAGLRPEAPAVATAKVRLTYGELAERVRAFAALLAASGIRPRDRVLVALPNVPATVVGGLAIQAAGAVPVEVNREWSPEVQAGIIARSGVRQALVLGRDARTWGQALRVRARLERLWVVHDGPMPERMRADLGDLPAALLLEDGRVDPALGSAPTLERPALDEREPALILYTSGSTGQPRGVVQTYRNVSANSRSIAEYLRLRSEDRALLVLPLYYCYGRSVLQTHMLVGGSVYMDSRFAFPRTVMEAMAAERCTGFAGVPLTFEILRRQVDLASLQFPHLRYLTQAGGAMAQETIDWARAAFQPAELFVMYGQTEATARLSYLPPARAAEKRGSIGIPIPGVDLRVVDDQGRELPAGTTGHLVARGANVTDGYLDEPEETAAILHDGWLWTGDLARRDGDGFLFHMGRAKEILKVGGHRVSPTQIEHVVASHPDIAEAAVVGAPDPLLGEVPVAVVVARAERRPTDEALRAHCRAQLAPYMVPAQFAFVETLPRNEAGKLLRAEVARDVAAGRVQLGARRKGEKA